MLVIEPSWNAEMTIRPLILEKLQMPPEGARISRPRLILLLQKSLGDCTSTILSARAGTGKTTLAVDFAHQCGRAIAWYKVDAPDGDLSIFYEYLTAAIRGIRPAFGSRTLIDSLSNLENRDPALLAERFVYELLESGTEPLLIVIEDLHRVFDADWLVPFFRRLLPLLPAEVHILITSRSLPPAPLWRMRSKQTLTVLSEETLRFTRQEVLELFAHKGLSREQAFIALDHTHGRAAALTRFVANLQLSERKAAAKASATSLGS
jgi:LuxR family transcriptional regulator, maltose regulon positive regulatory protein